MRVGKHPHELIHEAKIIQAVPIYNEWRAKEQILGKPSQFGEWRTERGKELGWCNVVKTKIRKEFQEYIGVGNTDVLQRSQME